jgi:hypothetical protein
MTVTPGHWHVQVTVTGHELEFPFRCVDNQRHHAPWMII